MYYFYLNKLQLPVPPAALSMKINGQNKTVNLINGGEVNIIKQPGLTDISFEFMIPHTKYPFASYGAVSYVGKANDMPDWEKLKAYVESQKNGEGKKQFVTEGGFFDAQAALEYFEKQKKAASVSQFVSYDTDGFIGVTAILSYLEQLKTGLTPFQFIVSRMQGNELLHSTNMKVTLESYDITESADNGLDLMCSVTLKQYRQYSTKVLVTDKNGKTTIKKTRG